MSRHFNTSAAFAVKTAQFDWEEGEVFVRDKQGDLYRWRAPFALTLAEFRASYKGRTQVRFFRDYWMLVGAVDGSPYRMALDAAEKEWIYGGPL